MNLEFGNRHILNNDEKEDFGLLLLMKKVNRNDIVAEEEIFKILSK